jgi:hypothetical protein
MLEALVHGIAVLLVVQPEPATASHPISEHLEWKLAALNWTWLPQQ